jgi:hypothetical protein
MKSKGPEKRYPRITDSKYAGQLTFKMWRSPTFEIREVADATEFVHSLPFLLPKKLKKLNHAAFYTLFVAQEVNVKAVIEKAYQKSKYKGKLVSSLLDPILRRVFQNAMADIFTKAKTSGDRHASLIKGDKRSFAKYARPRRIRDANRRSLAVRFARRYAVVRPEIVRLRKFVKGFDQQKDNSELKQALEKDFKARWIRCVTEGNALRFIPAVPGYERLPFSGIANLKDNITELRTLDWTARQLTVGILAEDKRSNPTKLKPKTILEIYIPLGNRILCSRKGRKLRLTHS